MKRIVIILAGLLVSFSGLLAQGNINNWRMPDQRGLNVFEAPKDMDATFDGLKIRVGGAFTQQYQILSHENSPVADTNQVQSLYDLSAGFNLATANLNLDVQLADGIRLNLITYLSARHHPEAWVKGGYIRFDKLPFNSEFFDKLMEKVVIQIGHMEINFGDSHFRRSDNGNAIYNPFVGNYIMDVFNTEIGAELYFMSNGVIVMVAATGGEINGPVTRGEDRAPSIYAKLGYDKQISDDFRFRLTGSIYTTSKSLANHLYDGDRGGSRYYLWFEKTGASASSNFRSGSYVPGFRSKVMAIEVNPFIKFKGLEFFGTFDYAKGGAANEVAADMERTVTQIGADLVYRFLKDENLYVAARFNQVNAQEAADGSMDVSIQRIQLGGGWFVTKNILMKVEYVNQTYTLPDNMNTDYRFGMKGGGAMVEAVVGF